MSFSHMIGHREVREDLRVFTPGNCLCVIVTVILVSLLYSHATSTLSGSMQLKWKLFEEVLDTGRNGF